MYQTFPSSKQYVLHIFH